MTITTSTAAAPQRRIDRNTLVTYGVSAVVFLIVAAPLLPIIYQSFIDRPIYDIGHELTSANYIRLFTSPEFLSALQNTIVIAVLATIISQVVGAAGAILVTRTDLPLRRMFGQVLLWPFFVSSLVLSFGWFMMYGPAGFLSMWMRTIFGHIPWNLYSIGGMALVAGITHAPLAMLYCMATATSIDPSLEEAARVSGAKPMRILRTVTLPLLTPAIVYSGLLNFMGAIEMLSVPIILGEPVGISTLTTFIYTNGVSASQPDHGLVGTAAVLMLLLILGLIFMQNRFLSGATRFVTVGGKAVRPRILSLGAWRWPAFTIIGLYALLMVILPLAMLLLRALVRFLNPAVSIVDVFTFEHFTEILTTPIYQRAIVNTIIVAATAGGIGTLLCLFTALISQRSTMRFRGQLQYLALFPKSIPGIVAGIGFFYAMAVLPGSEYLRAGLGVLILAYVMRYLPAGFGAIQPALMQISPELDRAGRTIGADWLSVVGNILAPLLRPAMLACFTLLFVAFVKEYSIAVFLISPGNEVIGSTLLSFWLHGEMGSVAALCCIQITIIMIFMFIARRVLRVPATLR
ncbi:MAG: iron ABC transporter permease [Rhodobacteraceae bacterium]|jgi:iron(III) transport system permease protein|nr:iron ABC transporter permease [Paracoccaceae bacterium]